MSRMVASISQKKPHFVSCSADGRFECDSEKVAKPPKRRLLRVQAHSAHAWLLGKINLKTIHEGGPIKMTDIMTDFILKVNCVISQ